MFFLRHILHADGFEALFLGSQGILMCTLKHGQTCKMHTQGRAPKCRFPPKAMDFTGALSACMFSLCAELFQQAHQRILQDRHFYGPGIMQDSYRGPFESLSPLIIRHGRDVVPGRHCKEPATGKQRQRSAHGLFVRHFQRGNETSEQHAGTCGLWPCFVAVRFCNVGAEGSEAGAKLRVSWFWRTGAMRTFEGVFGCWNKNHGGFSFQAGSWTSIRVRVYVSPRIHQN